MCIHTAFARLNETEGNKSILFINDKGGPDKHTDAYGDVILDRLLISRDVFLNFIKEVYWIIWASTQENLSSMFPPM